MKLNFTDGNLSRFNNGDWGLMLIIPKSESHMMESLEKVVDDDKAKTIEIKHFKEKRSLDANAMLWVLLDKMAKKLNSTDEEIYISMLKRYGAKDYIAAPKESEEILKRVYKVVEVVKDCVINDTQAVTYRLIRGSSTYDTLEFSKLLDGVIGECKELGIETMTPDQIERLIEEWGKREK